MPKVSVVMPVYNGERFLRESLGSVFAQTLQDFEVVCVDDGSRDNSADVLKQYGRRIRVLRQGNAGQSAARNAGVAMASGQYIAFLDQDDIWYPSKLARQVEVLEADPAVVVVHCNFDRIDASGHMLQQQAGLIERASALASSMGQLIGEALIFPSAMMIRKDIYERVGGFHHELQGFEDFDLIARLKQQGTFVMLEETGMAYRLHGDGFTRTGGLHVIRSRENFLRRMQELYDGDRKKKLIVQQMLADCYSDWGIHEVRNGNKPEGRLKLIQSLRCNPTKWRTYSRLLRALV
ncbi:MAG TPA: glycosyltransferase family A protein [Nitrospiraceae bacterium]|nr:glycosyltransferase family A protein [Nitrospiraceae bacterium]